ncbi:MAG: hypothetical protein HQL38_12195 [Alphaproteobacteria bacterium]|nr:hypothetical protein [Alphaproteobacteria bacterium]
MAASSIMVFLAAGGLSLLAVPAVLMLPTAGLVPELSAIAFWACFALNYPHFAHSYLLLYRDLGARMAGAGELNRLRLIVAAYVAPAVLFILCIQAVAFEDGQTAGLLVQIMMLLVGWHYVKQGYGVLFVLCADHGFRLSNPARTALRLHGYAIWAWIWLRNNAFANEARFQGVLYDLAGFGQSAAQFGKWLAAASFVWALAMMARDCRANGRLPPLAALAGYCASLYVWMVFAYIDPLLLYFTPAMHSLQYLYFIARVEGGRVGAPGWAALGDRRFWTAFAISVTAGAVIFELLPRAIAGAGVAPLGNPMFVYALVHAFVNVHHYFIDHAVWRREDPVTRRQLFGAAAA